LLEAILLPSKVIDDKYRSTMFITTSGLTVVGVVTGAEADSILVASNSLWPEKTQRVLKTEIDEQQMSLVSPMPAGLLDTLSKDEVLDLLAYLETSGNIAN
jgi:putative heme-binding domain-containing protein